MELRPPKSNPYNADIQSLVISITDLINAIQTLDKRVEKLENSDTFRVGSRKQPRMKNR